MNLIIRKHFLYGITYKITGHIIQKCQSHERQGNVESSFRLKETKEIQQPMQRDSGLHFFINNDIIKLKCFDVLSRQEAFSEYRYPHIP